MMGSTTSCTSHVTHSFSKEALEAHEVSCPTRTHTVVYELNEALDPEFITIQVRRGVLGLGLFKVIGDAMRIHCAPVRDAMIDDMVRSALVGDAAVALRKCFACVEVMKLVRFPRLTVVFLVLKDLSGHLQPSSSRAPPVPLEFGIPMRAVKFSLSPRP